MTDYRTKFYENGSGIVAIVKNGDKYLLTKEIRKEVEGLWGPPHGCIDPEDASEEAAVIRETKEGVGLDIKPIKKLMTTEADIKTKTITFWLVESTGDLTVTMDNHKASVFDWFTVDQALGLTLYPATRKFFEEVKSGAIVT